MLNMTEIAEANEKAGHYFWSAKTSKAFRDTPYSWDPYEVQGHLFIRRRRDFQWREVLNGGADIGPPLPSSGYDLRRFKAWVKGLDTLDLSANAPNVQHYRDDWTRSHGLWACYKLPDCPVCGHAVFRMNPEGDDPRGPLGDNAAWVVEFSNGQSLTLCSHCANDGAAYKRAEQLAEGSK